MYVTGYVPDVARFIRQNHVCPAHCKVLSGKTTYVAVIWQNYVSPFCDSEIFELKGLKLLLLLSLEKWRMVYRGFLFSFDLWNIYKVLAPKTCRYPHLILSFSSFFKTYTLLPDQIDDYTPSV